MPRSPDAAEAVRVVVIGCGVIAQAMHLPTIDARRDLFELVAVVDVDAPRAAAVAARYRCATATVEAVMSGDLDVDGVIIATSGDHTPLVLGALAAGHHVFVEKPLSLTLAGADAIVAAAAQADRCVMVGYMKWYDPAYIEAQHLVASSPGGLLQVLTIDPMERPYLAHHRLVPASVAGSGDLPVELASELQDIDERAHRVYAEILLDCCVHDLYCARGLLGDPRALLDAHVDGNGRRVHVSWSFDTGARVEYDYVSLEVATVRYAQRLHYVADDLVFDLTFPSPYLRHHPTTLRVQGTADDRRIVTNNDHFVEAFEEELAHFAAATRTGSPRSDAREGRTDVRLLQDVIRMAGGNRQR